MWRREKAMYDVFYAMHYHQHIFILFEFQIDIGVNIRTCYVKVEDDGMYLSFSFFCKKNLIDVYLPKTLLPYIVRIAGCGITRDELVLLGEKYSKPELIIIIYLLSFSVFLHFMRLFVMLNSIDVNDTT
jgi:hypothetical protein